MIMDKRDFLFNEITQKIKELYRLGSFESVENKGYKITIKKEEMLELIGEQETLKTGEPQLKYLKELLNNDRAFELIVEKTSKGTCLIINDGSTQKESK